MPGVLAADGDVDMAGVPSSSSSKPALKRAREPATSTSKGELISSKRSGPFHTLQRERAFRSPRTKGSEWPAIHALVKPHTDSFDMLFEGAPTSTSSSSSSAKATSSSSGLLDLSVREIEHKTIFDHKSAANNGLGNKLEIKLENVTVAKSYDAISDRKILPAEARERLITYGGSIRARLSWSLNDGAPTIEERDLGHLPLMVKSARCHLRGMPPSQLVKAHEEAEEMGGYFIINGNERLIRCLIVPRRNHVVGLVRNSFQNRGPAYTPFGVQIRSVRDDQTGLTNTVHYLSNGAVTIRFSWRKNEYMIPIAMVIKALSDVRTSDKDLFQGIVQQDYKNTFITDRVELLLRGFKSYQLYTGKQCREFLGARFRVVLACPEDWSDERVGAHLLASTVLVHLRDAHDRIRFLYFMVRKLYALVAGDCCADNPDSPQHQEILMPGFLYGMIIKEQLDQVLVTMRTEIQKDLARDAPECDLGNARYITKVLQRVRPDVGAKLQYFLATGNLRSPTGLDLQQATGFTVVGEKLNFTRYISHFRSVHRGAFFAELKTTAVRKLLPEAWGFLCPVHTPDGSPCGLLNHFSHTCRLVAQHLPSHHIADRLLAQGMLKPDDDAIHSKQHVCVQLDGRIIGYATTPAHARRLADKLRKWKTDGHKEIPRDLEIGLVPESKGGQYPGLYLFASRARMMRDVKYLKNGATDSVGSFEQVYLDIACTPDEIEDGVSSHVEFAPTNVLSLLANLTPFSDFNQSPRNMYQCQMSKQTMGTPSTALQHRTDNKLYRLQTGQTPIVRPRLHEKYGMDAFPNGTNAIVAVISYTGYDMEDAMIINKSAHERGFGFGSIYKSHVVDLDDVKVDKSGPGGKPAVHFGLGWDVREGHPCLELIDRDGLPRVGVLLKAGQPICAYFDRTTNRTKFDKYHGDEAAYVDQVRVIGSDSKGNEAKKVHIKLRVPRAPVIGDKFSSRHGQKGVCSQLYPAVDMPFSESGMQPDVIINPHAFPSRMTIGMFVESIAAKAGALHGVAQDATPFSYSEDDTPLDYFGEQLRAAGYNYFGNEPMYSGITGQEFKADIYLGVVYYQRLRHMVGDKWQVRTKGPIDQRTHQPIKGRKKGGGIRFGEMERDALIAHGTSFLLKDRLMNCSDYSTAWVCRDCGSLITLGYDAASSDVSALGEGEWEAGPSGEYCRYCRKRAEREKLQADKTGQLAKLSPAKLGRLHAQGSNVDVVAIPFVFRFLVAELAAMGIRISLKVD